MKTIYGQVIDGLIENGEKAIERKRLEDEYGQVWDTEKLQEEFKVIGFMAPFVAFVRKSDEAKGSLEFTHLPRFYFNFKEEK